jgi:hypothetical protein
MNMLSKMIESLHGANKVERLAKSFSRLGWLGFWSQVLLGSIPLVVMFYIFVFSGTFTGPRTALPIVAFLTLANLAVLLFTIFWFWRYPALGKRIANPAARPTEAAILGTVWTGLVASTLGILFSMAVLILDVGQLLMYFLTAPQAGIPAIQTTAGLDGSWVSAIDLLSLLALLLMLAAEVLALVLGLWLMFRTSQTASELA